MVGVACPLCCGEVFGSRKSLRTHLETVGLNSLCPYCGFMPGSLAALESHIALGECDTTSEKTTAPGEDTEETEHSQDGRLHHVESQDDIAETSQENSTQEEIKTPDHTITNIEMDKAVLLSGTISIKQELGSQQLKLLNSNDMLEDENDILIVGANSTGLLTNQSIITTQNDDGTISFTTINPDLEGEDENLLGDSHSEDEVSDEVYSCNTCGVSFTSVLEHIQKYHSDQDVVVEVTEQNSDRLGEEMGVLGAEVISSVASVEAKRVITDNGDIVETHCDMGTIQTEDNTEKQVKRIVAERRPNKGGQVYNSNLVQIGMVWDKDAKHYSCQHCSQKYNNSKSLCAHMKVHKTQIKPSSLTEQVKAGASVTEAFSTFKCEECDTVFPSNKSLRLHRRMHEPIKARPMEGPVEFNNTSAPGDVDTYHCHHCDKWIHVGYRTIHDSYHNATTQYHCEICNRKFHSNDCLLMHMNVHNTEKTVMSKGDKVLPYTCLYCPRQFARPHEKVKHERIHTGEKPHCCEICGKSFRVSYCLTLHMRTHTGARPYACQQCGKRFKAHSVYNHHLLTHSEVRAYKCPFCPKAFKTSVQLAGHKNSHTKPFSCKHCNRPFASLYAVRVHTETHRRQTNNLKFSCELCGASYARNFALKDHVKNVHNQDLDQMHQAYDTAILASSLESASATTAILPKDEHSMEVDDLNLDNSAGEQETITGLV